MHRTLANGDKINWIYIRGMRSQSREDPLTYNFSSPSLDLHEVINNLVYEANSDRYPKPTSISRSSILLELQSRALYTAWIEQEVHTKAPLFPKVYQLFNLEGREGAEVASKVPQGRKGNRDIYESKPEKARKLPKLQSLIYGTQ